MTGEGKIMRTVRCRNDQLPGELLPNPLDKAVLQAVARAVARQAIAQGLAWAEFVPNTED